MIVMISAVVMMAVVMVVSVVVPHRANYTAETA